jgi:hypothetical protein
MDAKQSIMKIEHINLQITGECNTSLEVARENRACNVVWPKVEWGKCSGIAAVVGAGPSLKKSLEALKYWEGDIYAVNDVAAYLSDNGIASYLFMVDCSPDTVKTGELIKGAVLATRCHPNQFIYDNIRTFDVLEDDEEGIAGGPSAPSRAWLFLLKMGYSAVHFFGCDSCFNGTTHLTRDDQDDRRMVIKANGSEYVTNLALLFQANYMAPIFREFGHLAINRSGGLMQAMTDHEDWKVVAVSRAIRDAYGEEGKIMWEKPYCLKS